MHRVAFFILVISACSIWAQQEDSLIKPLIDKTMPVEEFDFGKLKYKSGNKSDSNLIFLKQWAEEKIRSTHDGLKAKKDPNWILSDNLPELCLGLADEKRILAEIELLMNSYSLRQYQHSLSQIRNTLVKIHLYISDYEKAILAELNNIAPLYKDIARIASLDQGLKSFMYSKEGKRIELTASEYAYFEQRVKQMECENTIENTKYLKKYLYENSWPKRSVYGKSLQKYVLLVVQHASHDPELMVYAAEEAKKMVESGEVSKVYYPDLMDKIRIYRGQKQLFGTFITCVNGHYQALNGIENEDELDKRREEYELGDFEEKLKKFPSSC